MEILLSFIVGFLPSLYLIYNLDFKSSKIKVLRDMIIVSVIFMIPYIGYSLYGNFISIIVTIIYLLYCLRIIHKQKKLCFNINKDRFKYDKNFIYAVFFLIIGFILVENIIYIFIDYILDSLNIVLPLQDSVEELENTKKGIQYITVFLETVMFSPLIEELSIRVVIYDGILKKRMPKSYAMILTSFIFGIVHFNLYAFIGSFLSSIAINMIYEKEGFYGAFAFHSLNNLFFMLIY